MMKEQMVSLLNNLNNKSDNNLIKTDIYDYVQKICTHSTIISYSSASKLRGFISYYDNNKTKTEAFLTMLAIDPDFQGQGLGKRLLEFSIADLISKQFKVYKLEVLKSNKHAIKMYSDFGFGVSEETERTFYMSKELK